MRPGWAAHAYDVENHGHDDHDDGPEVTTDAIAEMFRPCFLIAGAIVLGGALGVVIVRNPVHNAALSLVLTLFRRRRAATSSRRRTFWPRSRSSSTPGPSSLSSCS